MPTPVHIQKYAPERRKRAVTTFHCGCTCCCCCCLHTIGSIVAAAVAPAIGLGSPMPLTYYFDEETGKEYPLIKKPGFGAVTIFWWILALLTFLSFAYGILAGRGDGGAVLITGIVVLLVFPALQLISAVITLIVFAVWPRPDKLYQLAQLGKITLGVVIGTVVGVALMFGIGVAFSAIR